MGAGERMLPMRVIAPISHAAGSAIIGMVWVYRVTLGWLLGGHCRYQPSCSEYMIQAVRKHGPVRGAWMGMKRIGRCHPWGGGGWDPP